jgi:hypothetical protein
LSLLADDEIGSFLAAFTGTFAGDSIVGRFGSDTTRVVFRKQ